MHSWRSETRPPDPPSPLPRPVVRSSRNRKVLPPAIRKRARRQHVFQRRVFLRAGANEQHFRRLKLSDEFRRRAEIQKGAGQNRLCARAGAQCAGAVRGGGNNRFAADLFRRAFARRVAEVEIGSAGLRGADFHAVTLAAEQNDSEFRFPHSAFLKASASEISLTGMTAFAPLCSAVTIVLVARSTSNTTQSVSRKSRCASAGSSAGVRMASIFIVSRTKAISFSSACNGKDIAGRNRRAGRNAWRQNGAGVFPSRGGAGNKAAAARAPPTRPPETRNQSRRRTAARNRQFSRRRRAVSSIPRVLRPVGNWRNRSKSNLPSAICRAAASRCGARKPILQARSSASVAAAIFSGDGNDEL